MLKGVVIVLKEDHLSYQRGIFMLKGINCRDEGVFIIVKGMLTDLKVHL